MAKSPVSPAALVLLGLCLVAMLYTGCSEKAGGTRFDNLPPETVISCSPAEGSRTSYVIQAYWYGSDPDGRVEGFEVAAVRPAGRRVPDEDVVDDPAVWGYTTSKESTFVFSADSCCVEEETLVIRVRDWGQSFDPASVTLPDVTAPLEERDLGGLGMFLIHQFMDEVAYTFDPERGNELTMRKRL